MGSYVHAVFACGRMDHGAVQAEIAERFCPGSRFGSFAIVLPVPARVFLNETVQAMLLVNSGTVTNGLVSLGGDFTPSLAGDLPPQINGRSVVRRDVNLQSCFSCLSHEDDVDCVVQLHRDRHLLISVMVQF